MSMSRKERRAAEHQARKAARKAPCLNQPVIPTELDADAILASAAMPNLADLSVICASDPPSVSQARLIANRANAQLSCGPKSESGKAVSSQNRLTHGLARHNGVFRLLPTEDPRGFEALQADLTAEHLPQTETESILVQGMAESHWLAQRAQTLQNDCFDPATGKIANEKTFSLYLRYETTHRRAFHKSLNDLLKLRKEKRTAQLGFEAQNRKEREIRLKEDFQAFKTEMETQQLAWQDPIVRAEITRLGQAAMSGGPEFDRLKAEFTAKHYPQGGNLTQAA